MLAHAGTFFLFSVVYPERATIPWPPPPITVLTDTTPENQALLRWIEAEDPALIAVAPQIAPANLAKAQYRASYQVIRTTPRTVEDDSADGAAPPAREPLSIIRSSEKTIAPAPLPSRVQPTVLSFSGGLATRPLAKEVALAFPRSLVSLEPVRFLVGVSDQGTVRFSFIQKSSGDTAFDLDAEKRLKEVAFARSDAPLDWGFATFDWGDDVYVTRATPPLPRTAPR